jgi:hypothetical protein
MRRVPEDRRCRKEKPDSSVGDDEESMGKTTHRLRRTNARTHVADSRRLSLEMA